MEWFRIVKYMTGRLPPSFFSCHEYIAYLTLQNLSDCTFFSTCLRSLGAQALVNPVTDELASGLSFALGKYVWKGILYPSIIDKMFGSWVNIFQFLSNCVSLPAWGMFFEVSPGENKPFVNG